MECDQLPAIKVKSQTTIKLIPKRHPKYKTSTNQRQELPPPTHKHIGTLARPIAICTIRGMQAGHGSQPDDVGVEWLNAPAAWAFYIGIIATVRFLVGLFPGLRDFHAWTVVNILHAVITFYIFHWLKGNPFPTYWALSTPSNDRRTWWEQLDHRWQHTPSRKFCVAVVCLLYLFAVRTTPPKLLGYHLVNFVAFVVVFVAKLPVMDSVRILGINR